VPSTNVTTCLQDERRFGLFFSWYQLARKCKLVAEWNHACMSNGRDCTLLALEFSLWHQSNNLNLSLCRFSFGEVVATATRVRSVASPSNRMTRISAKAFLINSSLAEKYRYGHLGSNNLVMHADALCFWCLNDSFLHSPDFWAWKRKNWSCWSPSISRR
jgi:hypothetical protein